jgi:hypothetical protein
MQLKFKDLIDSPPSHDTTWQAGNVEWTYVAEGMQSFFPLGKAGWIVNELGVPTRFYQYDELPPMSENDWEQKVKRVR